MFTVLFEVHRFATEHTPNQTKHI